MSQQRALTRLVDALGAARAEYMLTGSVVSSAQGQPRATHDIDIVVDMTAAVARRLAAAFPPPDYYADPDAAIEAATRPGMFNIIDNVEGDKIDVWALTDEPFDQSRFARRVRIDLDGAPVWASSPEDTILMKLRWIRRYGGGERHLLDAIAVYEVQGLALDARYLDDWATREEVTDLLRRVRAEARPIE